MYTGKTRKMRDRRVGKKNMKNTSLACREVTDALFETHAVIYICYLQEPKLPVTVWLTSYHVMYFDK